MALVTGLAVVLAAGAGMAADFPNKPMQLIVPYSAGGSTDVLARAIGQVSPRFFPQPMVVVNKAGGGGIPGRVEVVRVEADGYTQLFGWGSGEDLVVPHQRPLPYDIFKDFETVCRISVHSIVLAVPASSPHKTLAGPREVRQDQGLRDGGGLDEGRFGGHHISASSPRLRASR